MLKSGGCLLVHFVNLLYTLCDCSQPWWFALVSCSSCSSLDFKVEHINHTDAVEKRTSIPSIWSRESLLTYEVAAQLWEVELFMRAQKNTYLLTLQESFSKKRQNLKVSTRRWRQTRNCSTSNEEEHFCHLCCIQNIFCYLYCIQNIFSL